MDTLSKRIREARLRAGMTLAQAAEAAGVQLTTVHRWEKGDEPKVDSIVRFAEAAGVDLVWLLKGATEAPAVAAGEAGESMPPPAA